MRKILFRGKRKDKGEWVEGFYVERDNASWIYPAGNQMISRSLARELRPMHSAKSTQKIMREVFPVDPATVGQYTGLQDKNGKRIFEGDVFKFPDEVFESFETSCGTEYNSWDIENYGVVAFCEFSGRFDFVQYRFNQSSVDADLHENHDMEFHDFVCELEVIGNIHDNPELMDGGGSNDR